MMLYKAFFYHGSVQFTIKMYWYVLQFFEYQHLAVRRSMIQECK